MPQTEQDQIDELNSLAVEEQTGAISPQTDESVSDTANLNAPQESQSQQKAEQIIVRAMPKEFLGVKEKRSSAHVAAGGIQKPPQMGNKKFLIILALLVILLIGGGVAAYVVLIRGKGGTPPPDTGTPPGDSGTPIPIETATPVTGGGETGNGGEPVNGGTETGNGGETGGGGEIGNGKESENGKEDPTVALLGSDLVQRVVVSYNDAGVKTTEAVLSIEHEDTVRYSKITITEHVPEKKSEYFAFVAGQPYEVRLRGETPSAKSVLSITFTPELLEKLDLIPADLRIGFLPFARLEEELYRQSNLDTEMDAEPVSSSASLMIASIDEGLNDEAVTAVVDTTNTGLNDEPATGVEDATKNSSDESEKDRPVEDSVQTEGSRGAQIWEILKAQDLDDDMYSVSSVLQGIREGIYAIVPIQVNDLIELPEKPIIEESTGEPPGENGEIVVGLDSDMDLLTDREELLYGTSPLVADSDLDGYNDGAEVLGLFSPARGKGVALADDTQFARYVHSEYQYSVIHPKQFSPKPLVPDANKDIIFVGPENESVLISIQDNAEGLELKTWVVSLSSGIDVSQMEEMATKGGFKAVGIANKTAYYLQVPNQPYIYVFSYTSPDDYNYLATMRMMAESFAITEENSDG